jgi:hypothetical protein
MKETRLRYALLLMTVAFGACDDDEAAAEDGCTDEFFCVDGGLEGNGKDPGGKNPGDKQFSGWAGDAESLKFTLYAGGLLVCDITYPWMDQVDAEGCEDCAFARRGTLGDAAEDTNSGDCGQATGLSGTQRGFGHGATPGEKGYHTLYEQDGGRWNAVLNGGSFEMEGTWGFFIAIKAADGGDSAKPTVELVGHFDDVTMEGHWSFVGSSGGETVCEHRYPLLSPTAAECPDCDFSWSFELGPREIVTVGDACDVFGDLVGVPIEYGHAAPDSLYTGKEGGWTVVAGGTSAYEAPVWDFRQPLSK